jgi:hypothetical protein
MSGSQSVAALALKVRYWPGKTRERGECPRWNAAAIRAAHLFSPSLLILPANIINVIPAKAGIQRRALRAHLTGFRVKPGITKFILFPGRIDSAVTQSAFQLEGNCL